MAGKRKNRKKWVVTILAVLAVAVIAFMFLSKRDNAGPMYAQDMLTVGDIATVFSFTGSVTAPNSQALAAPSDTTVREVYAQANQAVKKGDRLLRLEDGTLLKSDLDGEVTLLSVRKGDVVTAGRTLCEITDLSRLEVEISIDEYDVEAISLGKQVDVYVTALDRHVDGTIQSFNKQAAKSGELAYYTAVVAIDTPEGVLPGMQVEVTLTDREAKGAVLVKAAAVWFDERNEPYLLVAGGGGYERLPVQTGISDGSYVQILSGASAGTVAYYEDADLSLNGAYMMMRMRNGGGSR
ncbi:MAG: HlyD family efflux transporter periplasmic adaptor subunit [Clostridia bacterium]|nr:HlyD family efflux transporter periplasmic adaptor subunit [Clostridia bacterium]